jgi:hypothetical protein
MIALLKATTPTIWTALHDYRDKCIPDNDDAWDNICTHMAWIKEELELDFDD